MTGAKSARVLGRRPETNRHLVSLAIRGGGQPIQPSLAPLLRFDIQGVALAVSCKESFVGRQRPP